jgi:ABC-type multidrug transport system ATPase subunit
LNITLKNTGKRFNREWIFRNVNFEFSEKEKHVILGSNGSGKSTLLQIISGAVSPSEGEIKYDAASENLFRDLTIAAPYLELPEEMKWKEAIQFHGKFKKFIKGFDTEKIISLSGLQLSAEKEIRNFSSGMKQRAKLSLAILSDTSLLLLDEPSTNLDEQSVKWYQHLIEEFAKEKTVIVCSNYNKGEYSFCSKELKLS